VAIPHRSAVARRAGAFGNWNTIYKTFNRWAEQGVWARVLEKTQALAQQAGDLDWVASIDSTIVRVHQHGATLPRTTGGGIELQEIRRRAIRSRNRPLPGRADDEDPSGL
jgi:transposase